MKDPLSLTQVCYSDVIICSLQEMNIEALRIILSPKYTYNDISKDEFLNALNEVFIKFKTNGCNKLNILPGICAGCQAGARVIILVAEPVKKFIALVVERNSKQEVCDIYSCNRFSVNHFPQYMDYNQICFDRFANQFYESIQKHVMPVGIE